MTTLRVVAAAALCFANALAWAQFPTKPVKIIVAYAPGGGSDLVTRVVTQKMSENTGKAFVVENRVGAGGRVGFEAAMASPADGYTLVAIPTTFTMLPGIYGSKLAWTTTDLTPITTLMYTPFLLAARPGLNASTLNEFIALARAAPGKLNYGTPGVGSSLHVFVELFMRDAKISMTHIPYKGISDAVNGMLSGQVDFLILGPPPALPQIAAGKITPLAVAADRRLPTLPTVPTTAEAGMPGFIAGTWEGLAAPRGTPPEVIDWLHREVSRALSAPEVRERIASLGAEPLTMTPAEMASRVREETQRWTALIKSAGIVAE